MGHPAARHLPDVVLSDVGNGVTIMENLNHMLHELLKILSQPPGWLTSIFSIIMATVAGFFGGLFRDLIVPDLVGRRNMQSALYRDLAEMFFAVDRIMNVEESMIGSGHSDKLLWRQEQFRQSRFLGEKYYSDNPAIYIQLPERFAVQTLYRKLQYVLEQPATSLPFNSRDLARTIAFFVDIGVLKRKYFKKYLCNKENAKALLFEVDEYNRQRKNGIQRLIEKANAQKPQDGPDAQ